MSRSARKSSLRRSIPIDGSSFVVVASGFAQGPAQPLIRYLVEYGARSVVSVSHPLLVEEPAEHRVATHEGGKTTVRRRAMPNRPPLTYLFDPVVPLVPPRSDVWIGFNCLATAQGLVHRRLGRTRHVVHWNVDFVPNRFGPGLLTSSYDALDRLCCRRSDGRVELSEAALRGRIERYGLRDEVPAAVVPMGAWTSETPIASPPNLIQPRVVFLGHLVERMGVDVLVDAMALLRADVHTVRADIIGGGPLVDRLRHRVEHEGLGGVITVHGFVDDFRKVQSLLSRGAVAAAPYEADANSFSRFADPGKLKAYLAAGLPVVLTDVPPNASELASNGGASIVPGGDPVALAEAIRVLIEDPVRWQRRHEAALRYATRFDWETLFTTHLPTIGLEPRRTSAPGQVASGQEAARSVT